MNLFKILLCSLFCLCHFFCEARAFHGDSIPCEFEIVENKIYIQPEQILITHEGIFVLIEGAQVLVRQLNCDERGLFCFAEDLDKITDKCPNGHKIWCGRCGGCVTRWCKFRCKCVEWE
jgi:hypothetical protein